MKKDGVCVRGELCPYAHNVFEYWLHPTRCEDGLYGTLTAVIFAFRSAARMIVSGDGP